MTNYWQRGAIYKILSLGGAYDIWSPITQCSWHWLKTQLLKCVVSMQLFYWSHMNRSLPILNRKYQTSLILTTPGRAASNGILAVANESEQTGTCHQSHVAYLVTNKAMNINQTAPRAKWNIENEDQLVELWQQHECRLMQVKPQQGWQGKGEGRNWT